MNHRGETVEKAVRDNGIPISSLAKKLGKSRRHIYNLFQYHNLDWETIAQVGEIIKIDFTDVFPEFKKQIAQKSSENSIESPIEDIDFWKNKYISLLEEYNKLLKK